VDIGGRAVESLPPSDYHRVETAEPGSGAG